MATFSFDSVKPVLITCAKKVAPLLAEEVRQLNMPVIKEGFMSVETEGTMYDCMRLNLQLRTGHRVLYHIASFDAKGPDALYKQVIEIPWEEIIDVDGYFSVLSYADNEEILDTRFANLRCKDAIADRFMDRFDRRPDSGPEKNKTVIFLHWRNDSASIYVDTSGDSIARHGYRKIPFKAPLQESLAAAIILHTKWDRKSNFINPMCGSGTLAIEAALLAQNRAPGLLRSNYGFMHVKGYSAAPWEDIRREIRLQSKKFSGKIIATDLDPEAIEVAKKNAATAGVDHVIEFKVGDFRKTEIPEGGGVVVMNPEYGERLGEEEKLKEVYKAIGDFFKQSCKGYMGYVFTGNLTLGKNVGLRPSRRIEMYNSKIDCRLFEFELYDGSKKQKAENQE